ncbi:flagellar hook protein FlgE [Sporomusa malonica]|uniref:Flagellar hook protein FlgE n=1 Tax=Sporomusa malonica TaxID=112901 RepID=A0A1W2DF52_9FIRM|nr:flagellar hook protein FlgE [Sporomusa malonica]SMC96160.1 flagellar hook protein FlgE [Sporomusa malonica]
MMKSMYSAVSGLRAQQTKLDVIGNNIANVNTVGYKAQRATFSDLFSQVLSGASGPDGNRGGVNPKQVGLGAQVASLDMIMTPGGPQFTGNPLDLSISGSGFFIVQGGQRGDYQFTRAGNFGVDKAGNLTVGGMKVCGWQDYGGKRQPDGSYVYDTQKPAEPINVFSDSYNGNKRIISPKATTKGALSGNLDPAKTAKGTALDAIGTPPSPADYTGTMTVYDALGNSYEVQAKFSKCYVDSTDADNPITSWYWEAKSADAKLDVTASGYIKFDKNGKIVSGDTNFNTKPQITLTPKGANAGAAPFTVNLDFSGVSTFNSSGSNEVKSSDVDGYAAGDLDDISIGDDGVITGVYSNGQKQPLGMLALATFDNPAGLEKIGGNLYVPTVNSGDYKGGVKPGTGGASMLSSSNLEMSNVDLAEQFSEMMITQRAFQANSKIITASDQLLQDLIGMVR